MTLPAAWWLEEGVAGGPWLLSVGELAPLLWELGVSTFRLLLVSGLWGSPVWWKFMSDHIQG